MICIEDIDLHRSYALVTWQFVESGVPITSEVAIDFEGADRSVGVSAGWICTGDCPQAVLDAVAVEAASDAADRYEDEQMRDPWEDR